MIYLSLGTNLGDREANLIGAIALLNETGIHVVQQSSLYETAPRDVVDQPWFLNMVVQCRTSHAPVPLMAMILAVEKQMGRDRSFTAIHRGPRLIDIDILLYDDEVIQTGQLTLPHPRLLERRFVLEPLLEIAPDIEDPRTNEKMAQALAGVIDQELRKLT